jgi:N-acylneuraminate cytidylyltransferase
MNNNNIKNMKIFAFIFARSGSKEVKNKNIKNFLGKPLLIKTIDFAKKIKFFDKIILSSDSNKILSLGRKNNLFLIKRPKKLASDNSPEWLSWKHAIEIMYKRNYFFDLMVVLPCTSPLRIKKDLQRCISSISFDVDVVTTVTKSNHHPSFNMVSKNSKNYIYIYSKTQKFFFRRQDAKPIFNLTNSIYVTKPNYVLSTKNMFDGKVKGVEISQERSIDIDSKSDFIIAEELFKKLNLR